MSSNPMPSETIMTSPIFRYAVLVVLIIVVVLAAGVCYRTRVYRRQILAMHGFPSVTVAEAGQHDWGSKPTLFDVFLRSPGSATNANEKSMAAEGEHNWEDVMPVSLTRGGDILGISSSLTRVSVMINMPSTNGQQLPFDKVHGNTERDLPYVEFGSADLPIMLPDMKNETESPPPPPTNAKASV